MPGERTQRSNYLVLPRYRALDLACRPLSDAFEIGVFLVGSCMQRPDYRDVDVRAILEDDAFAGMFPGADPGNPHTDARWTVICMAVSEYLGRCSQLPIDFQIQQMTAANAEYGGERRSALGLHKAAGATA